MGVVLFNSYATLDIYQSSNVAPLDALLELSNWGEGAIINGRRYQEKRRNRGPAYCQVQEKGGGFGHPAGGS